VNAEDVTALAVVAEQRNRPNVEVHAPWDDKAELFIVLRHRVWETDMETASRCPKFECMLEGFQHCLHVQVFWYRAVDLRGDAVDTIRFVLKHLAR
jgi:hypothetical protein